MKPEKYKEVLAAFVAGKRTLMLHSGRRFGKSNTCALLAIDRFAQSLAKPASEG